MRSWVEIELERIAANYRLIRDLAPEVEMMPVVKANAYGHGMIPVATTLVAEGAQWLAVSSFEEGLELRGSGIRARILVMADVGFDPIRHAGLTPVIHSLDAIPNVPYHLKIDTGMHRLGVLASPEKIAQAVRNTPIEGMMAHFASSSDFVSDQTAAQQSRFQEVLNALDQKPLYIHASSSNPLHFGIKNSWFNMARPGLALYGYVSSPRGQAPFELLSAVKPALTWKARIIATKDVSAGEKIGYSGLYIAEQPTRIAILGAGYADGLSRRLSNKASFVGAISMDVSTIDISDDPELQPGDEVTLLGPEYDARAMARDAGLIAYSVLTGISSRVRRVYL